MAYTYSHNGNRRSAQADSDTPLEIAGKMTLSRSGHALDVTNNATIGGTLGVAGLITGSISGNCGGSSNSCVNNAGSATQLICSPQGVIAGAGGDFGTVNVTGPLPYRK